MSQLIICLAQINTLVGDIPGNTRRILEVAERALTEQGAHAVVFPELALTGYPPEDLLLRPSMQRRVAQALQALKDAALPIHLVLGYPWSQDGHSYNMAGVIYQGECVAEYAKQHLPNYQVFDEVRYFTPGTSPCVFDLEGIPTALTICEDIWQAGPMAQAREAGARLMLNLNASPFHRGKAVEREAVLRQRVAEGQMPIIYTNLVGAQDELVFDGGSMVMDASAEVCMRAPQFEESLRPVTLVSSESRVEVLAQPLASQLSHLDEIYQALVLGLHDYVTKNGFPGVVLGLSGGIDSALTLAIAVDALGADRVEAVMMPFRYTSDLSKHEAAAQATTLGVHYNSISIEPMYDAFMAALADSFRGRDVDATEENLQARCRGVLLMAISNKKGSLVLTTGNKSELAVGYSTLYGDMAGGFDVLKDVPKSLVFALARHRNQRSPVIPESVINRPPSAELAPDQKDEDSLPPYEVLDEILSLYVESDYSAEEIVASGFSRDEVMRVIRLVDINEYKRRQAPIGPRITQRGFGRDRRYPITSGWKAGD